jgi:soluble lytic murein transglycosylase
VRWLEQRRLALVPIVAAAALAVLLAARGPQRLALGGAAELTPVAKADPIAVDSWSDRFAARIAAGDWSGLVGDLDGIRELFPDLYGQYALGYLHGRARVEAGLADAGRKSLEPFLARGDRFRDLALFHGARAAAALQEPLEAARLRETLILEHPDSPWRPRALEEHAEWLSSQNDPAALDALLERLGRGVEASLRRELQSRAVAALAARGDLAAVARGRRLLKENTEDDAAERVALALDREEWLAGMGPLDWLALGESLRSGRHFERALLLLRQALAGLPSKREQLLYAIARVHFSDEAYADAERVFLEGAQAAAKGEARANFFYQAGRCAQLLGDDARAERHLGQAIAHGGGSTRTSSALTQRARLRARLKRYDEAVADVRAVQRRFARSHAIVEATLALALPLLDAGRAGAALRELDSLKPQRLATGEAPEIQYWRARALEGQEPRQALRAYLAVLRADTPSHFAYFARARLRGGTLERHVRAELQELEARAERAEAKGEPAAARRARTDAVLLAPASDEPAALERLRALYARQSDYAAVLELQPPRYPRFPLAAEAGRLELLLAMGLFDDAPDRVVKEYPLRPFPAAIARADALRRGGASRASIYAAEVAQDDVPDDYVPQLQPRLVRELLFPRYYEAHIQEQSRRHGADPRLVLSIMREESRFNPRAKSAAAARGLLQFILTTARQVAGALGRTSPTPQQLYDPQLIIELGAKYVGDLQRRFGGNRYAVAAAYNAGPNQAALWLRMAAGAGDDFYLSAINFDETKNYVRKVMNSYARYGEIYESHAAGGGIRAQP